MRATLDHIKTRFDHFNRLCFNGELPAISMRMSDSLSSLGTFVHPRVRRGVAARRASDCHMRISRRLDMPEEDIDDIVVHEMIHYYIWWKGIADTSVHGKVFRQMADGINRRHGLHITVRRDVRDSLETDTREKHHYICVTEWDTGQRCITVCARTCIFEIHEAFSRSSRVRRLAWYWSSHPWFNRFGCVRTPKGFALSEEDFNRYVASATPCECDGQRFGPARK